jgi:hypothetical protein
MKDGFFGVYPDYIAVEWGVSYIFIILYIEVWYNSRSVI